MCPAGQSEEILQNYLFLQRLLTPVPHPFSQTCTVGSFLLYAFSKPIARC